jgi:uncharacterized damage-inducible protein DinB
MPMDYAYIAIPESEVPRASSAIFQHLLDIYAGETNKVISVWREFTPQELPFRPHARSSSVEEIMKHQLLSERRFFGEFLGVPEHPPDKILPQSSTPESYATRLLQLARPRLAYLAPKENDWWLEEVPFFDVTRLRIWIFWRRVLHTAHHRTQLTVYLRLLGKRVPSTYGPTADVTWAGADPTVSVSAAGRGSR